MRTVKIKDTDGDEIEVSHLKGDTCDIGIDMTHGNIGGYAKVIFNAPAPLTRLIKALTTARDEMEKEQK